MDVFSRKILIHIFQRSVRKTDVIRLFRILDLRFNLKGVTIRNDNGSQFIANQVREAFRTMEAQQEFTHVATPEENAYIEAFHSIVDRELIQRFEFSSYYDANKHIEQYISWYNDRRRHREIGRVTPNQKWAQGQCWSSHKQSDSVSARAVSRPDDTTIQIENNHPLVTSLDSAGADPYICLLDEQHGHTLQNQKEISVQLLGG